MGSISWIVNSPVPNVLGERFGDVRHALFLEDQIELLGDDNLGARFLGTTGVVTALVIDSLTFSVD